MSHSQLFPKVEPNLYVIDTMVTL